MYGRGQGRLSAREQQFDVTSHACRFIAAGVAHWGRDRPLSDLPEGNGDWFVLKGAERGALGLIPTDP